MTRRKRCETAANEAVGLRRHRAHLLSAKADCFVGCGFTPLSLFVAFNPSGAIGKWRRKIGKSPKEICIFLEEIHISPSNLPISLAHLCISAREIHISLSPTTQPPAD